MTHSHSPVFTAGTIGGSEAEEGNGGMAVAPSAEECFITDLVSQVDVRLRATAVGERLRAPLTAAVLARLYNRFMYDLLRRAHFLKASIGASADLSEISTNDICNVIRQDAMLYFLNDLFIDADADSA